jgi:hypothetical protein
MAMAKIDGFPLYEEDAIRATPHLKAGTVPCVKCRKSDDVHGMIEAYSSDRIDPQYFCIGCWANRGAKPNAAPAFVPPVPVDPRTAFSASSHKTLALARERAAKVASFLGVVPEISPLDPNAPGPFFVCPDSPLVPGFKAAVNPHI